MATSISPSAPAFASAPASASASTATTMTRTPDSAESNESGACSDASSSSSSSGTSCSSRSGASSTSTSTTTSTTSSSTITSVLSGLRVLLLCVVKFGPLWGCWGVLLTARLVREIWRGPLEELLRSYVLDNYDMDRSLGTYNARDHEQTYYFRRCDQRDISTHDANDLLIREDMTRAERASVIMTHGAVVMKDVIGQETAGDLREYLETRHREFHANDLRLSWNELFWDGDNGNRLSLGLGSEDAEVVARAIAEVGSNAQLKRTLEATLGDDPAVVEVSTLSTMHNAEPQGIHTDSDWFGSSVMYARSFLHSYTMFIALQDTSSKMGATTVCPGTHWCADEDLYDLCQCPIGTSNSNSNSNSNDSSNDNDNDNDSNTNANTCNTFEASSNGHTGLDVGVLQRGDAMMFNQNIWHRGPRNYDEDRKQNRVMFILTFVSRRDFPRGDNRQQGWGTYYYMRHSMWGHLFSDLRTAATGGMDLFASRIWKAYGLASAGKPGNLPWLEHWARQLANDMDFFRESELDGFREMLRELRHTNPLLRWFLLDDAVLAYLFGARSNASGQGIDYEHDYEGTNGSSDGIDTEDDMEDVGWKEYLTFLVEGFVYQSKQLYCIAVGATALVHTVGYLLYCLVWCVVGRRGRLVGPQPPLQPLRPLQPLQPPILRPLRDVSRTLAVVAIGHGLVLALVCAARHHILHRAPLFRRIQDGSVLFRPVPDPPTRDVVVDGEPRTVELYATEILHEARQRARDDARRRNPAHPYQEFYDREGIGATNHRQTDDNERAPVRATAFPERSDVLIGSRFDATFLASMNAMLDFHPGNKEWIGLLGEWRGSFLDGAANLELATAAVVSKLLDPRSHPVGGGTPRRVLEQDFETGWWVVASRRGAALATRRALLSARRPRSVGVVHDHWNEVLAEARFGRHRGSAMARTWVPGTVDARKRALFGEHPGDQPRVSPVSSLSVAPLPWNTRRPLLPGTGRGLLPKSMVTGTTHTTTNNKNNARSVPPTVLPFREHLTQWTTDVVTLGVGDHVLYKGADDDTLVYQATIATVYAADDELEIRPLRNDVDAEYDDDDDDDRVRPTTRFVRLDEIQFYRPVRERDFVWALWEGDWKVFEVLCVSPFGQADLLPARRDNEEDDDDYDDDDDEPITVTLDVRELCLTERHLPTIRLRQY